jgi:hypothetical protein
VRQPAAGEPSATRGTFPHYSVLAHFCRRAPCRKSAPGGRAGGLSPRGVGRLSALVGGPQPLAARRKNDSSRARDVAATVVRRYSDGWQAGDLGRPRAHPLSRNKKPWCPLSAFIARNPITPASGETRERRPPHGRLFSWRHVHQDGPHDHTHRHRHPCRCVRRPVPGWVYHCGRKKPPSEGCWGLTFAVPGAGCASAQANRRINEDLASWFRLRAKKFLGVAEAHETAQPQERRSGLGRRRAPTG